MKNLIKLVGITAFLVVIGFSMAACKNDTTPSKDDLDKRYYIEHGIKINYIPVEHINKSCTITLIDGSTSSISTSKSGKIEADGSNNTVYVRIDWDPPNKSALATTTVQGENNWQVYIKITIGNVSRQTSSKQNIPISDGKATLIGLNQASWASMN